MRAELEDTTLAESSRTIEVEGNPYFPADAVRWQHLRPVDKRTLCTWKGLASYFDVEVGARRARAGAWVYRRPFPWIRKIRDRVAFSGEITVRD